MNVEKKPAVDVGKTQPEQVRTKDNNRLEHFVSKIDSLGREHSDADLKAPGRMTPGAPPADHRS